jgi:hypothetical protein
MARQIILNGTVANDGTGDTLRATADKINSMTEELYGSNNFGSIAVSGQTTVDAVTLSDTLTLAQGNNVTITTNNSTRTVTIDVKTSVAGSNGVNSTGGNTGGGTGGGSNNLGGGGGTGTGTGSGGTGGGSGSTGGTGGNSGNGNPGGSGGSVDAGGGTGGSNSGPGNGGGVDIGGGESGDGDPGGSIHVPGGGTGDDMSLENPGGDITIGDPTNPGVTVPPVGDGPVVVGNPDQPAEFYTGLNEWELTYTGSDGKLDSSQYLKVTADADDTEGKSLHLHTALYDTGGGSKIQSTIYFVDDVPAGQRGGYSTETANTHRAASLRFVKQSLGQGLIFSPFSNYNDGAFHNKGGVAVWRTTYGALPATKVTLNDDAVGPSIHGLYLGSGAIGFFQDLTGGETPDTDGLTYVVLPGIPDGSGVNKVGQIFANPYRNRNEAGTSGVPYFGLGWKQSTQLGSYSTIEEAERIPGNEVITWHTTNRVGIMNTNPNWTLTVNGDIAFTKTLRVGVSENAGNVGEILTSTGPNTAPIWSTTTSASYNISAETATAGAYIRLNGSDATTDDIKLASGNNVTITRTDANTITIDASATGNSYNVSAETASAGAYLRLNGSDGTTDDIKLASGNNVTVLRTDANTITISSALTTYNVSAETATGGAYIYLNGSDNTTDNVKIASGNNVTVVRTDANTITINAEGDVLYNAGTHSSNGTLYLDRNNGTIQKVTLTSNVADIVISNITTAKSFTIIFTQDATGGRTMTAPAAFKFASNVKTLSIAANSIDMLNMFYDGSTYYCTLTTGYA